ncbi:hypothetical protein MMC24_000711 [Lignoscripta atroalba]|nr:hypothetical protein [Lignoscripta atroalba]
MSITNPNLIRCCARTLRSPSRPSTTATSLLTQHRRRVPARRCASTAAASSGNSKVAGIVDQISQLTLLETADLVSSLKSRLNIPDMQMGGFAAAAPAAPAPVEEEEAAPAAQAKTLFTLTLKSFEAAAKPKIIKEIKSMLGLSLVDSKKFVESAPKQMKEGVPKEECEKIVETMKALGGVVVME